MTREDIIRTAKKAGFEVYETDVWITDGWWLEELERFAELVRADEREVCAKACEETTASWTQDLYNSGCMDCAAAIRARGET